MNINYFSVKDKELLGKIIEIDNGYYEDNDLIVDVIGVVNLNEPIELSEGEEDTREPQWSEYLFNVLFKNDSKLELFKDAQELHPETPIRTFGI